MDDDKKRFESTAPSLPGRLSWPAVLAALTTLGLLLALGHVVGQGVRNSSERRVALALHDDAAWRCSSLHGRLLRDRCLREIDAPLPTGPATLALDGR
jgi:hypothetical protein